MDELTKTLNNGCFFLKLVWGEKLYLNCCPIQAVEATTTKKGNRALLITTERGRFWGVMTDAYYSIDNPTAADMYDNCATVKDYCCY